MKRYWLLTALAAFFTWTTANADVFAVRARIESVSAGGNGFVAAHEAIPGLMDAMIMPFEVRDPAEIEEIEPGDLVTFEFVVEKGGSYARNLKSLPTGERLNLPEELTVHDHAGHNHSILRGPAGIMGDHTHTAGGLMFSYRWTRMKMEGMRDGTRDVTTNTLFEQGYMIAPESMTMDMHMFMAMYAVTDRLTLMTMAHYMEIEMQSQMRMHAHMIHPMDMQTEGWGDTALSAIYKFAGGKRWNLFGGLGLSLPTGSTDEADPGMHMENKHMAYPMQLGSGTYDLKPSITWTASHGVWCWGAQGSGSIRIDDNEDGYALGDRLEATAWLTWKLGPIALSSRLAAEWQDRIEGLDKDLGPMAGMINPAADPASSGGTIVTGYIGLQSQMPQSWSGSPWIAVEIGAPLYQNLNGPQMKHDYTLSAVVSTSF